MDGAFFVRFNRAAFVNGFADNVQNTTKGRVSNGHHDRAASIVNRLPPYQTFGRVHRNSTNGVFTKVLCDFKDQPVAIVVCFQSVQDFRQVVGELNVDNGTDHLRDFAFSVSHMGLSPDLRALPRPK